MNYNRFKLDLSQLPQRDPEEARKESLERIRQWREADQRLKQFCEEKGIEVPVLIC